MDDKELLDFGPIEDQSKDIIKVIGVGGGGCNAVNNMYREGIVNVSFAVCNTDSQSLKKSPVPVKIQLGDSGLGAGANPELGRKEAEYTQEQINKLFEDNTKMCFVTAGMGGGTGTGAAPVIARIAKSKGILTIGIVTIPFFFEKRNKIIKALKGVEEMRKSVDSLLIINNERLCDVYSDADITIKDAFKSADRILSDATKSISELITVEGNINLDFRDVETTMHGGGGALMAMGRANGEKRVQKAILDALDSPLLYGSDISKAKNILFNIYTSDKAPLFVRELQEIDAFMYELDPNINVIWGTSDDNTLDQDAKVVILATGLDNEFLPKEEQHGEDSDSYYDRIISKLYKEDTPYARYNPERTHVAEDAPDEKEEKDETSVSVADVQPTVSEGPKVEESQSEPNMQDAGQSGGNKETESPVTVTIEKPKEKRPLTFAERVRQRISKSLQDFTSNMVEE